MPLISALAFSLGSYGFNRGGGGVSVGDVSEIFFNTGFFTVPDGVTEIEEYLIVAGGGGGGGDNWGAGVGGIKGMGGAGAGGVRIGTGLTVTPGDVLTITVGAGGVGVRSLELTGGNGFGSSIAGVSPYGSPASTAIGTNGGGGGSAGPGDIRRLGHRGGCGAGGKGGSQQAAPGQPAGTPGNFPALTAAPTDTANPDGDALNVQGGDGGKSLTWLY